MHTLLSNLLVFFLPALSILIEHFCSALLLVATIAGLAVVFFYGKRPALNASEKWVMWIFWAYAIVYILSFLLHGLMGNLLDPRLKYIEDALRMLCFIPVFIFLRYAKSSQLFIWVGIITGASLAGIYACISFFWISPGVRVGGAYDAIAFGDVSLALGAMSIASYDYLNKHHHVFRFFALAAFLLGVTASLLSGSRGAWLAIPGLFVVLYFYTRKYLKRSHQALIVSVFIAAAFVLYQVPETKIAPRINSVFSEIHNYLQGNVQYGGATVRILGWRAGITIFSMHPITGSGTGNYKPLVDRLVAQDILHEMTAKHSQPASTFLETMVACGIPGLLALIGIFIAPFRLSMHFILDKDLKGIGYALMMLVVAFTIFGLTEAIFRRSMFTGFYVFMTAALIAIAGNIKSVKQSGRTRDGQPEQL